MCLSDGYGAAAIRGPRKTNLCFATDTPNRRSGLLFSPADFWCKISPIEIHSG